MNAQPITLAEHMARFYPNADAGLKRAFLRGNLSRSIPFGMGSKAARKAAMLCTPGRNDYFFRPPATLHTAQALVDKFPAAVNAIRRAFNANQRRNLAETGSI